MIRGLDDSFRRTKGVRRKTILCFVSRLTFHVLRLLVAFFVLMAILWPVSQAAARQGDLTYEELVERNLEFRKKLKEIEEKYTSLENERNVLIVHIKNLQIERNKLLFTIRDLQASLPEEFPVIKAKVEAADKKLAEALQDKERLQKSLEELNTDFQAVTTQKSGLETEIAKMKEEHQRFESEMKDARSRLQKKEENLDAELKEVSEQKAVIESTLMEKAAAVKTLEAEKSELEGQIAEVKADFEKQKNALENQWRAAEERGEQLEKENLKLSEETAGLRKELQDALKEKQTFDKQLKDLESRFQSAEKKSQQYKKELDEMRVALQDKEQKFKAVVTEVTAANKAAEQKNKELVKAKSRLEQQKKRLEKKIASLEKRLVSQKSTKKTDPYQQMAALREKGEGKIQKTAHRASVKDKEGEAREAEELMPSTIKWQKLNMHYNLALTYHGMGLYKQEEEEYLKCLRIDPHDADVHYNLAILYDDKLNQNKKAVEHYRKYLELRPHGEDVSRVHQWLLFAEQESRIGAQRR